MNVTHGGNKEHVVQASAGITFSLVLTDTGKGTCCTRTSFAIPLICYQSSPLEVQKRDNSEMELPVNASPLETRQPSTSKTDLVEWLIGSLIGLLIDGPG